MCCRLQESACGKLLVSPEARRCGCKEFDDSPAFDVSPLCNLRIQLPPTDHTIISQFRNSETYLSERAGRLVVGQFQSQGTVLTVPKNDNWIIYASLPQAGAEQHAQRQDQKIEVA